MLYSTYPKKIGSVQMRGEVWMEIRNDRQKGLSYTRKLPENTTLTRVQQKNMRNPKQDRYTI